MYNEMKVAMLRGLCKNNNSNSIYNKKKQHYLQ